MNYSDLQSLLIRSADRALTTQHDNGSMIPGHNGPWQQIETPARNTAHWAMTFTTAYNISNDIKFKNAAIKCGEYLESETLRPSKALFHCKYNKQNPTNGLIGQAWILESLLTLGSTFGQENFINLAQKILGIIKFNQKYFLWHTHKLSGEVSKLSYTLNQQIYYSSIALYAAELTNDQQLMENSKLFFKNIDSIVHFDRTNMPLHKIVLRENAIYSLRPRNLLSYLNNSTEKWKNISLGYLSFIIYSVSNGKKYTPQLDMWESPSIIKLINNSLENASDHLFDSEINSNNYQWSYNPSGFEVALGILQYQDHIHLKPQYKNPQIWIEHQIKNHYSYTDMTLSINSCDPLVLSARMCELARILD